MLRLLAGALLSLVTVADFSAAADMSNQNNLQPSSSAFFVIAPGGRFRDCEKCPEMVVIPSGTFLMGSPEDEIGRSTDEGPVHEVVIPRPFAIGRFEVTFKEWQACVDAEQCREAPYDRLWAGENRPINNISWQDTQEYLRWLSQTTGENYRLPSEAEWEFAARAGTTTPRYWQEREIACAFANVYDMSGQRTHLFEWQFFPCVDANGVAAPVGTYVGNDFGLHDMLGNVWEWVEDCWNADYAGAPADGRARLDGECSRRIIRGGSWKNVAWSTRAAFRGWQNAEDRIDANGFRVARFSR